MSQKPRGYAQFVEIRQSPGRVFEAFVDPMQLEGWYAAEARIEPRLGGRWHVKLANGGARDATIDVWEPGHRLRLVYLPDPRLPPTPSGPIVEDVMFDVKAGRTVVRLLGSGVSSEREWDPHFVALRRGWAYSLHALKRYLEAELPADQR